MGGGVRGEYSEGVWGHVKGGVKRSWQSERGVGRGVGSRKRIINRDPRRLRKK
jgi:hypothetical protein